MASSLLPIVLTGDNLGQRHHHLNSLVHDVHLQGVPLAAVKHLPETTALDRIFKIELASKHKEVEYIIENLKHEDMLYVSKALKSTWLLDAKYSGIVNPAYLENVLYFEMATTAVTKMRHWIELNLKDPVRCEHFYQFYLSSHFNAAVRFLQNCSKEFIMNEASKGNMLEQLDPHQLKLLIERCSDVAKVYFNYLENNQKLLKIYLEKEFKFYETFKLMLKVNGDVFLDFTEKNFNHNVFGRFSPEATKYIMIHYKERFNNKPELYTYMLLDIKILAKHLSIEEIKDLILKLARATYLQDWFSYKNVEPLIKRLSVEERTLFKKMVFVDKSIGECVENWPYKIPSPPELKEVNTDDNVFNDKEHDPREYFYFKDMHFAKRCIKKKCAKYLCSDIISTRKSSLDLLFDRYRFVSFEKTLFDLKKQLSVETLQHRQNIMLVLISKSGGRVESLQQLLKFLTEHHINEAENLRATVIRSLVRRCSVWRMPQHVWEMVLKFGWGVGLDGNTSTVACKEGIHAVIIRHIILDQEIEASVWKAFINEFSTLNDYSLNSEEKRVISTELPKLLVSAAENEAKDAVNCLDKALDSLDAYKIHVDKCPHIVAVISKTAQTNSNADSLLHRLFSAKVARKELFKENFKIIQNNASYYNALKHDTSLLVGGDAFEQLIKSNELKHDKFIKTLALYFNEKDGLSEKYLAVLKKYMNDDRPVKNRLARCIAILSGDELEKIMKELDDAAKKCDGRRFGAALRGNCHLARPLVNVNESKLKSLGAKAVANRILKCSTKYVDQNIQILMTWSRTQRLALVLSMRIGKEVSIVEKIAEKRPRFTLKTILKYVKRRKFDEEIWDVIVALVANLETKKTINVRLREVLTNVQLVPANKKPKYCTAVYELFQHLEVEKYLQMIILCHIEQVLPEIDCIFSESVVQRYLNEEFICEKLSEKGRASKMHACLIMRISAKYLLLCKSNIEQEQKWENFGKPFFDHFDEVWKKSSLELKSKLIDFLDDFFLSLKYNRVFLNTDFVSPLPMFERIINRLQNILPLHEYFGKYVNLHLTMIYFRSVRQSMKNNPTIFENLPKNLHQATEIVGRIFGKMISLEAVELTGKYFDSILEIYKRDLRKYLNKYFEFGESRDTLVINVVRSILEYDNDKVILLAEHIYEKDSHEWPKEVRKDIVKSLMGSKSMEVRFVFQAHCPIDVSKV